MIWISKNRSWYWFDCICFFRVKTKHKIIFYFFFIYFLHHHLSFRKTEWAYCCLPSKDSLIIHYLYSKDGFTYGQSIQYKMLLVRLHVYRSINPLPHMAILGFTNSAAKRDMMSKIWMNGDTIIWLGRKHCGKRRNCSLRAISSFPKIVFISCLLLIRQNEYLWSTGLKLKSL